jgi:hypothetical protein
VVDAVTPQQPIRFRSQVKRAKGFKTHLTSGKCSVSDIKNDFSPRVMWDRVGDVISAQTGMIACGSDAELKDLLQGIRDAKKDDEAVTRYWRMCVKFSSRLDAAACVQPFTNHILSESGEFVSKSGALCWMFDHAHGKDFNAMMAVINSLSSEIREAIYQAVGRIYFGGKIIMELAREEGNALQSALTTVRESAPENEQSILSRMASAFGAVERSSLNSFFSGLNWISSCERGPGESGFTQCCSKLGLDYFGGADIGDGSCSALLQAYVNEKRACVASS